MRPSALVTASALRDQACERLREAILTGELRAGERLSINELAETYGVSTMPVREALRRLESEGLVETSARRWTRVVTPDRATALEVYPMIVALEELALDGVRHDLDGLNRHIRALREAVRDGDLTASLRADEAFHTTLAAGAGNATLSATVSALRGRVRLLESLFFSLPARGRSPGEHDQVITALSQADVAGARQALRMHWERGQREVLAALDGGRPGLR
jgi:DNA-binding GntR family transcriptional regulator